MTDDIDFYSEIIKNWMDRTFEFRYKYLEAAQEATALKVEVEGLRKELDEARERMVNIIETHERCDRLIDMGHRILEVQRDDLISLCRRVIQWEDSCEGTGEEFRIILDEIRKKIEEINRQDEPWEC